MSAELTSSFASYEAVLEGWYWAMPSAELKAGQARALNLMGRELVLYRGENGHVVAMDAYCPHMGAHLGEGWVQGNSIRCVFHYWKFAPDGACSEAPCFSGKPPASVRQKTFPVEEKYGLIWVWAGRAPRYGVPCPPELEGQELDFAMGRPFRKNCHPHVLLINAIDENHFASVHHLPFPLHMESETLGPSAIEFRNTTRWPEDWWFPRWMGKLYRAAATYKLTYWNGSTGAVTLGPDFLHFYILFVLRPSAQGDGRIRGEAIRPNPKGFLGYLWSAATFAFEPSVGTGGTEGWPIVVTKRRKGILGKLFNKVVLFLTGIVGQYFAAGDSWVFRSIRFRLKTPVKADHAILTFIRHAEAQPVARDWTDDAAAPAPAPVRLDEEAAPR